MKEREGRDNGLLFNSVTVKARRGILRRTKEH
jgi:hypothetical protein